MSFVPTTEALALVGSFIVTFGVLIFGSRLIVDYLNLFPGDNSGDPLTLKNILHQAWGSSKQQQTDSVRSIIESKMEELLGDSKNLVAPLGIAALVGLAAIFAFYAFGNKKKPVLDPNVWKEYTLVKKTAVSHNTAIYRFGLPNSNDILGLPIGQHISVQAEINGKQVQRSYTPISSDDDVGHFDLMVKSYEKGNISRYLSLVSVGDKVRIKGPKGQFNYHPGLSTHLGMIAGGTGITPMLQIIRAILKNSHDHTHVSLIYANVTFDDILLKEEIDHLAEAHPDKFTVYYVLNEKPAQGWDGGVGFISKTMIQQHMPAPKEDIKLLMCGPPPMMEAMKKHIAELGYEKPRTISKLADQIFIF